MSAAFTSHSLPSSPSLSPALPKESWRSSYPSRQMNSSRFAGWGHRRRSSRSRSHSRSPSRWNNNGLCDRRSTHGKHSSGRKSPIHDGTGLGRTALSGDWKFSRVNGALPPQSELFAQDIQQRQRSLNVDRYFNRHRRHPRSLKKRSKSPIARKKAHGRHQHPRSDSPQRKQLHSDVSRNPPILPSSSHADASTADVACNGVDESDGSYALVQNLPESLDWDQVMQAFSRFNAIEVCYACNGLRIRFLDTTSRDAAVQEMDGFELQSHNISVSAWSSSRNPTKDLTGSPPTLGDPICLDSDHCAAFVFEALLQTSVEQAWRDVIEAPVFRYLEEWSGKSAPLSPQAISLPNSEQNREVSRSDNCDSSNILDSIPDNMISPGHTCPTIVTESGEDGGFGEDDSAINPGLVADSLTSRSEIRRIPNASIPVSHIGVEFEPCIYDITRSPVNTQSYDNVSEVIFGASHSGVKSEITTESERSCEQGLLSNTIGSLHSVNVAKTVDISSIQQTFDEVAFTDAHSVKCQIFESTAVQGVQVKNKRGRPPGSKSVLSTRSDLKNKTPSILGNRFCSFCGADDDQDQMAKCWNNSCQLALHIYCMAPPLRRVPRQWACDNHNVPDPCSASANFEEDAEDDDVYEVKGRRPSRRLREQREMRLCDFSSGDIVVSNSVPAHDYGCARTAGINLHLMQKRSRSSSVHSALPDTNSYRPSRRSSRADRRRLSSAILCSSFPSVQLNSLSSRKKNLQLFRSAIHAWGVRTCEPLYDGDLVIEYIGERVSARIADIREKRYERVGIGSSYFFKIDNDLIIDATKKGNLARYINHSCTPNCRAKVVSTGNTRRIAIYAKQFIDAGEELCYDYKFPSEPEEDKIPCWCGTRKCRGYLN